MLSARDLALRLDAPIAKVEAALANLERLGLIRSRDEPTPMAMTASMAFANVIDIHCDVQCPAMQDAIDRLVAAEGFRGRSGMLATMRSPLYTAGDFNSALLSAWKPEDIKRATGQSRDWWIDLADRMGKRLRTKTDR